MSEQYLVTVKKKSSAVELTNTQHRVERITLAKTIINSSFPKKSIIDILLDASERFDKAEKIHILNRVTWYQRWFDDISELVSWVKKLPLDKLCDIDISFKTTPVSKKDEPTSVVFSVNKYHHSGKGKEPKLLKLEIIDFFTGKLIIEKDFSDFKKLDNFVQSHIDPCNEKFLPNNPCVNVDCRFIVNDCDFTDYFLEINDLDINCQKTDDTQFLEYNEFHRMNKTTIHHVLAIGKDNEMPSLVYSSVVDELDGKYRERGISEGHTWEREMKTPRYEDDLYYQIIQCHSRHDTFTFQSLIDLYSNEYIISSFVCIELTNWFGIYDIKMREVYFDDSIDKHIFNSASDEYADLIPPHKKWTYEDFDAIL